MELKDMKKIKTYHLQAELNIVPFIGILLALLFLLMAERSVLVNGNGSLKLPEVVNTSDYPKDWNMVVVT